jgi:hypothetical protein
MTFCALGDNYLSGARWLGGRFARADRSSLFSTVVLGVGQGSSLTCQFGFDSEAGGLDVGVIAQLRFGERKEAARGDDLPMNEWQHAAEEGTSTDFL